MTTNELNVKVDAFKAKWLGKKDDFDLAALYQCVDVIKRFYNTYWGIANVAVGVAIRLWTNTPAKYLEFQDRIATTDVKKGDTVIFRTVGRTDFGGAGHTGLATGIQTEDTVEVIEQNGSTGSGDGEGGNRIRLRSITKSRVVGVLRPKVSNPVPSQPMPAVGSKIQLLPPDTRTTFVAGTPTAAGQIRVTDNTFIYTVRGYDPKYPGRVIINSASAGGNGVGLALYYLNGQIIPGWKAV